ncbi:MAG TPA: DUF5668 domain-containing protein [Thermoclostridium sp.]
MDKGRNGKFVLGITLICIGFLLILSTFGVIPSLGRLISKFWPMIFIFISLLFHAGYYSNKNNVGLLVPGGILLTLGVVFQTAELWDIYGVMWPGVILAPAVGLYELYYFGNREKGLLIPVGILSAISLFFFTFTIGNLRGLSKFILPAGLIFAGLIILIKDQRNSKKSNDDYSDI